MNINKLFFSFSEKPPKLISSFRSRKSYVIQGSKKSFQSTNSPAAPLLNDATKEQMVLYTKLFLIMGLSWIFEVLEPFLMHNDENNGELENCNARVSKYCFWLLQ